MMPQRRRILFVSSNFPPVIGGSSIVYDQLCRNASADIVALGASCRPGSGQPWPGLEELDAKCGYAIHRLPHLRPPHVLAGAGRLGRILALLRDDLPIMLRTLAFIVRLVIQYRVETVCIGELLFGGWLTFPLRYVLRRRVIIYTHGEEVSQEDNSTLGKMRRLFLHHAHAIVSVSLFCKSQIVSAYAIAPDKIHVVPNGVNLDIFSPGDSDRSPLPPAIQNRKLILSVSRLVERKGQEQLIQALPLILAEVPDAHCLIVGDGPLAERLHELVDDLGLNGHCTFFGEIQQDSLVRLYRCSDLFALPCRTLPDGDTEGFGLVFLEANACGLPVVAGAAGGTIEAVFDDVTGLLVDGTQPQEIARAVIRILTDAGLARRLAEAGRQRAQGCGWPQVTGKFTTVCYGATLPSPLRAHAPTPREFANIALPPSEEKNPRPRLLVTLDVEEKFDWTKFSRRGYSIHPVDSLANYHERCRGVGIRPVYCVADATMRDQAHVDFFSQVIAEESGEVGIHLHSWTTPPYWETPNVYNSFQCNLPAHVERRKLEALCRLYEDRFGRAVTIHRAGRWGGNARTSGILKEFGIKVDLSPSAGFTDPANGGPDFRNLDGRPFWSGPDRKLLVIPASSVNYLRGPRWFSTLFFSCLERMPWAERRRAPHHFGKPVRFSPEGEAAETLSAMVDQFVQRRLPVAVYSLHSTSLRAGGTPYAGTAAQAEELRLRSIDLLSHFIKSELLKPSSCDEIYKSITKTAVNIQ